MAQEVMIMSSLKPVSPCEAKAVWATIKNPSARRVAKALSQAGRRVHHSTIARWRAQSWRAVAKFITERIPSRYGVATGEVVDQFNISSPQLDVLVFDQTRGRVED